MSQSHFPSNFSHRLHEHASGILPEQWIDRYIDTFIEKANHPRGVQPGSLDLRVGAEWFSMPYTATPGFLPRDAWIKNRGGSPLESVSRDEHGNRRFLLLPNRAYVARCEERLTLPSEVFGVANPKSSIGRIDVHVRLLTESGHAYDQIPHGYCGDLFLEIVPRSFPMLLSEGTSLAQIRFVANRFVSIDAPALRELHQRHPIVRYTPVDSAMDSAISTNGDDVVLSASLRGAKNEIVAFEAKQLTHTTLDLQRTDADPRAFWKPIFASDGIVLEPGRFCLLRSRELLSVPGNVCAEMLPFDASQGEYRAHYAGFFDNGFGLESPSAAVLEVRNHHSVPMLLSHGQPVCKLRFMHFAEAPATLYGGPESHYQGQRLALAKFFAPWPVTTRSSR